MRNELKYMFFLVVALILGACSKNNDVYDNENTHKITFTIAMTDPETVSRATWGEDYEKENGVSFDYYIKPESLKVRILTEENSVVGEVENLTYWKEDENSYRFMGEISSLSITDGDSYKVEVIANCPVPTDDNWDIKYSRVDDLNEAIPMWGIQTAKFTLGTRTDIGTIDLLRAAAKVEVKLSDELMAAGYEFDELNLTNYRNTGYCLPYGYESATATADVTQNNKIGIEQESCIRETNDDIVTEPLSFSFADNNTSSILYIPEYVNLLASNPYPFINVRLKRNGVVESNMYKIQFCNYIDGFPTDDIYNIVRNHIYRFTITQISGDIVFIYVVADWIEADKWNYTLDYPTYNPIMPDSYINRQTEDEVWNYPEQPTMYYDANNAEAGAFSCWFKMSGPEGQVWTPVIDMPVTQYDIVVYKNNEKVSGNELVADPDAWYNIKVIPLDPDNMGKKVNLGITYSEDWQLHTSVYLLINKKMETNSEEIAWPNSGNDNRMIQIEQIEN